MVWIQKDYSKDTYFRWKIKWRQEHLGALGTMGEAPLQMLFPGAMDRYVQADCSVCRKEEDYLYTCR